MVEMLLAHGALIDLQNESWPYMSTSASQRRGDDGVARNEIVTENRVHGTAPAVSTALAGQTRHRRTRARRVFQIGALPSALFTLNAETTMRPSVGDAQDVGGARGSFLIFRGQPPVGLPWVYGRSD